MIPSRRRGSSFTADQDGGIQFEGGYSSPTLACFHGDHSFFFRFYIIFQTTCDHFVILGPDSKIVNKDLVLFGGP